MLDSFIDTHVACDIWWRFKNPPILRKVSRNPGAYKLLFKTTVHIF